MKKLKTISILMFILLLSSISLSEAHILVLHRFSDDRYPSSNISKEKLISVFNYLNENNYNIIKMSSLIEKLKNKDKIPDKTIVFTIDDGYKSFYDNGFPIFKNYNVPFTNFINTKAINLGYGDYMSWSQIKEIAKYGEIGSHSYSHAHLTYLPLKEAIADIEKSVNDLEKNLNQKIEYFSYPYGEYNEELEEELITLNKFEAIFPQNLGAVSNESNIYRLNRFAVTDDSNLSYLLRHKFLKADWAHSNKMLDGQTLKKVIVNTGPKINKAELYISKNGWQRVQLNNGKLDMDFDIKLPKGRTRIFLKTYSNEISCKLLVIE